MALLHARSPGTQENWPNSQTCAKPKHTRNTGILCMEARPQTQSPRAGGPAPRTVLVVDTNPALLQTFDVICRSSGWTCISATDTLAALCGVIEHAPQAVVLDADAGPLEVWEFCALLREHPAHRHVRVIVSSARDGVVERARAEAAGVDAFLARPFAVDEVLALIEERRGAAA
jgi:twitching motility two-component system response regulator PilG